MKTYGKDQTFIRVQQLWFRVTQIIWSHKDAIVYFAVVGNGVVPQNVEDFWHQDFLVLSLRHNGLGRFGPKLCNQAGGPPTINPLGFPSNEIILTLMFLRIDGNISKCRDCKNWTYEDGLRSRFQSWTKCVILCGQFETQGQISDSLMVSSLLMIIYITKFFWTEAAFWSSLEIANDRGKYICFQHIDLLRIISPLCESLQKSGQSRAILLTCLFAIVY